jgi:hypothetical protein
MRVLLSALAALVLVSPAGAEKNLPPPYGTFSFELSLILPGTPDEIFGAITGDIGGWWDHKFSENPKAFYLEPRAGGAFMEVFDDKGNGVRHAEVIYCDRPKMIRFEGPLGLTGHAIHMVFTYKFEAVGADSTRLTLVADAAGHVEEGWAAAVEGVWKHFLIERFKPYVEAGRHRGKG